VPPEVECVYSYLTDLLVQSANGETLTDRKPGPVCAFVGQSQSQTNL